MIVLGGTTGQRSRYLGTTCSCRCDGRPDRPERAERRRGRGAVGWDRVLPTDVTDADQIEQLIEGVVDTYGEFSVRVNCTGSLQKVKLLPDVNDHEWETALDATLTSVYSAVTRTSEYMAGENDAVVTIASLSDDAVME